MSDVRFARGFVPAKADMGDSTQIGPLSGAPDAQLDQWILDESELAACLSEKYNQRLVEMTCQTDDQAREQAHLHFDWTRFWVSSSTV
ncbi:MAG: hypothetical protein ACUVXJ_02575 [Phycisphaerae bacterium]